MVKKCRHPKQRQEAPPSSPDAGCARLRRNPRTLWVQTSARDICVISTGSVIWHVWCHGAEPRVLGLIHPRLIHADILRLDSCEVGSYDMPVCILSNVKCIQILIAVCTFNLSVCCKNKYGFREEAIQQA